MKLLMLERLEWQDQVLKFMTPFGENIFLFEVYGTAKVDRIIEVFNYARKRYGVTHFLVDSLSKCGLGEDDYKGQKVLVDRLMEFAGEHDVHVHRVVHIRKFQDETTIPVKFDAAEAQSSYDAYLNCVKATRDR